MEARILSVQQLLHGFHDGTARIQSTVHTTPEDKKMSGITDHPEVKGPSAVSGTVTYSKSTLEAPSNGHGVRNGGQDYADVTALELNGVADLNLDCAFSKIKQHTVDKIRNDSGYVTPSLQLETKQVEQLASDVLDVIQRYGQHIAPKDGEQHQVEWIGKPMFMAKVMSQLEKGEAVKMILPAFPWKSINKVDKVTGVLPDLGEELALARLNQMCEDIRAVYPMGGQVWLATDGLVFDDIVGIPDHETWAYSEYLVQITRDRGYDHNIRLLRVMDILGYTSGQKLDWGLYISLAQRCRDHLMTSYGRTEEEVRAMMREDSDTLLTYCGFIRFLESDLRYSQVATTATSGQKYRKCVKKVAINMMIRAESFTKLLQASYTDYVRLSIHPSTGTVKLSIPLVITGTGEFPRTPWHSAIALAVTGVYSTVHRKNVQETHTSVFREDATESSSPHYFREKSALWDWDDTDVVFQPHFPNTLVVRPRRTVPSGTKTLTGEQITNLQALIAVHTAGPVRVEGFTNSEMLDVVAAV
ncbi:hypothetical protein T440DRAFT_395914 [Plenodomus tracheiphilus IPT5]|uniref:Pyoverdine/dityrosine biosynthesis protein n=1 Tax=Plenodomus tracheiphilus IPT5 TaxID=1408161 RepID=A0A6A7B5U9_9PLEO|nr:hypothetical protein T440DRAFT_395914 [Plenodomus tracheiphilus IPT5]